MQCVLGSIKFQHLYEQNVHVLVQHVLYEDYVVEFYSLIVIEMLISLVVKAQFHGRIFKSQLHHLH